MFTVVNKQYPQAPRSSKSAATPEANTRCELPNRSHEPLRYPPGELTEERLQQLKETTTERPRKYRWEDLWQDDSSPDANAMERFRPPRDVLVQALALVTQLSNDNSKAHSLYEDGRTLWLSNGMLARDEIIGYLQKLWQFEYNQSENGIKHDLRKVNDEADNSLSNKLIKQYLNFLKIDPSQQTETNRIKYWTVLNDNRYSRIFDSEIARELTEHPPLETLGAVKAMGRATIDEINCQLESSKDKPSSTENTVRFMKNLCQSIDKDIRPWFSLTPNIEKLRAESTIGALETALTNICNGFDMISALYLIVKSYNALARMDSSLAPQWFRHASANYGYNIKPRKNDLIEEKLIPTADYGILLPGHPPYRAMESLTEGNVNYTIKHRLNPGVSEFNKNALQSGHPVICGLSGSTNILSYLANHIKATDQNSSLGGSTLGTIAYLVFDGGHSLNEIMHVYHASTKLPGHLPSNEIQWRKWYNDVMNGYEFNYNQLTKIPDWNGDDKTIQGILDNALTNTIDYFERHDLSQSQNEAAEAKIRAGTNQIPTREPMGARAHAEQFVSLDDDEDF